MVFSLYGGNPYSCWFYRRLKDDYVFVYFCINFVESESQMTEECKVTKKPHPPWFGRSYSWIDIYCSHGDLECVK